MRAHCSLTFWAAVADVTTRLDGRRRTINLFWWKSNKQVHGKVLMLFSTRRECLAWIKYEWGYLARRKDLRVEPHCWRTPRAVHVTVTVKEIPCATRHPRPNSAKTRSTIAACGIGSTRPSSGRSPTHRSEQRSVTSPTTSTTWTGSGRGATPSRARFGGSSPRSGVTLGDYLGD